MMYEQYKNINLPWLNEIPYHWDIYRNKIIFTEMKEEVGTDSEQYRLLSLTLNGIIPRDMDGGGKFPGSFDTYKIVKPGYMAFCLFDVDETPRTVGLSDYDGMLTGAYTIMKVHDVNARYVYYYYLALDNQKMLRPLYTGLRKTINVNTFQSLKIPIPPRTEQDQIVRFLDWKVSMINRLIGIKKKQIDTIKAFRGAMIEKLLHQFPAEETIRMKQLGTFFKGGGFSRENLVDDKTYPAILYGDIYTQYEYQTDTVNHHIDEQAYNSSRKIFKGDIVMAGTGETKDEIGKAILYMGEEIVAVGGDVIAFHPNEDVNAEYLLYQLYSQNALKHRYINGKGDIIVHIYPIALGNTVINLPNKIVQCQVVTEIDTTIHNANKHIEYVNQSISVLQELKTRLIADTVTGKIDVRNIEIPEYEFVREESQAEEKFDAEGSDNGE